MTAFLGILLALFIVAVIVGPFIRRSGHLRPRWSQREATPSDDEYLDRIFAELRTLRSELAAGNLTENEYSEQLDELRIGAARVLRDQERRRTRSIESELLVEQEVRRLRRQDAEDRDDSP